ncbi:MraY family glycosyltransferase [Parabacteroides goldsteinii]|uniref:UDP-phosphate alpha-N-acetylglucosaminyltransferase n=2 Tax=Parabacteroides goldsteinii TaxID=328812 RepID=A0A0J6CD15_9BACT|nr:MraY family glycosyltransferase [Parabacteroides goldsteinii]KKB47650.1 hypothetical protein HMPREF1535_04507 [Parabacteroides goldsteinii DSM 19448 = WAL 12034]KMM31018.1 UDP-phosphate alpha-N-acetylglucosaminyltransferase [Parabacteroides goldsteinii]
MTSIILIIIGVIISILFSSFIIPRILVVAFRKRLFDVPDERKVHQGIVPRLGGLSFAPSILFTLSFTTGLRYLMGDGIPEEMLCFIIPEFYFLVCGLTLLFLTGIKDDLVGLRYRSKFVMQILAAIMVPLSGLWINNLYGIFGIHELTPWLGVPLTVFLIVFICNAINLIDGIDGLASGLSCVSLAILGCLYVHNHLWMYAMLAFASFGVLVPFFYYNVFGKVERCRKIFMGDTGSLTLGYILSFLIIRYTVCAPDIIPYSDGAIIVAFSTIIIPMLDVMRVMFVRWRSHKGIFVADKNHIHHKLLSMGLTQRQAMLLILTIACLFSGVNICLISYIDNNILISFDILVWVGLNLWFDRIRKNI